MAASQLIVSGVEVEEPLLELPPVLDPPLAVEVPPAPAVRPALLPARPPWEPPVLLLATFVLPPLAEVSPPWPPLAEKLVVVLDAPPTAELAADEPPFTSEVAALFPPSDPPLPVETLLDEDFSPVVPPEPL